jgi:hypothetical protein
MDIRTDIDMKNNSIFNSNLEGGVGGAFPTYTNAPNDVPQGELGETWQPPGYPVMTWRPAENDLPSGWNGAITSVNGDGAGGSGTVILRYKLY